MTTKEHLKNRKWVWLVLSGSGMRLYAFLGALKALTEAGYSFLGVTGTSGGAVVSALLGKHWDPTRPVESVEAMVEEAKTISVAAELTKSFRWRVWEWVLTKVLRRGPKGMFETGKLLQRFREQLPATIEDCNLPVHITGYQVNLKSPRPVLFTKPDTDLPLAVLGSMSLPPPLFDPTMYGKAMLQDGGWAKNFPVPDNQPKVVGLYFDDVGDDNDNPDIVEDPALLEKIDDNIELWLKVVFGLIDTNMRDAINEAEEEGVELTKIQLQTTLNGFDFFADKDKIERAIDEGYESAKKVLSTLD